MFGLPVDFLLRVYLVLSWLLALGGSKRNVQSCNKIPGTPD